MSALLEKLLNDETFDQAKEDFEQLTNTLANLIFNVDDSEVQEIIRKAFAIAKIKPPGSKTPTPKIFNTTKKIEVLENAKKGTEHHKLYKAMLSLSQEQKNQLKEKFGTSTTLTQFAICNLILLYTEGSKLEAGKGARNAFAFARQALALSALFTTTDRNLKLEFLIYALTELRSSSPFSKYQHSTNNFITDTREASTYPRAKMGDNTSFMTIITRGVNTQNALMLFDNNTLEIITTTGTAAALEDTASGEKLYADGAQTMFSPAGETKTSGPLETLTFN